MNTLSFLYYLFVSQLIILQNAQSRIQGNKKYLNERNGPYEFMRIVIDRCFNKITGSYIVIGDWHQEDTSLLRTIQSDSKSVYLFDGKYNGLQKYKRFLPFDKINKTVVETKVYPATNVTLVVSSRIELKSLLNDLRGSIWWDHEAHFLIINNAYEDGCNFARQFLNITWNFNILSAIYFCIGKDKNVRIFTFNPYDRVGTAFWKIAGVSSIDENYWTMLEHSFDESFNNLNGAALNCNSMKLERVQNLNRLNVNIGGRNVFVPILPGPLMREVMNDVMIFHTILHKLNATYTFKTYQEFGFISKLGPTGSLKDLETGSLKIVTNLYFIRDCWKQQNYPHEFNSLCIVTKKHYDVHSLVSFDLQDWVILVGISLMAIGIIKYVFHHSFSRSLLELIRMLTNGQYLGKVTRPRQYFFLFCVGVVVTTTSAFLVSRLTAYKTAPGNAQQINSVDDLIESNFILIGGASNQEFLYREEIFKIFKVGKESKCVRDVIAGQKKACILYCSILAWKNLSIHVHEVKELLSTRPSSFTFTEDWPLFSKIELILNHMVEAGIYRFLRVACRVSKWNFPVKPQTAKFVLSLKEFKLGFYLLFTGYTLALCAFVSEIFTHCVLEGRWKILQLFTKE